MKSVSRSARIMTMTLVAAIIVTGCARHPQVAGPVSASPATAKAPAIPEKAGASKVLVAKVNDVELSMDALVKMMNNLPDKSPGAPPESLEERKKRALESLVLLELAYQRAKAQGLGVDPYKIDLAIGNFKDNAGGEKEYTEYLTSHNLTEADLRSEVERSLTIKFIYDKEVVERVAIPEEELKREYEKEKPLLIQSEKVSVIDVYVPKNEEKDARKKAGELLALIRGNAGQDPWKLVLDGTFTVRRLAIVRDREKELYDAATKLKPQALSGVIDAPGGFHIIKLESYSPQRPLTFDEAKPKIEGKLKGLAQEKRTREWEQELKKGAKIEIIETGVGDQGSRDKSQESEVRNQKANGGKD